MSKPKPLTDRDSSVRDDVTDEQRIALGSRPRTLHGWWFWVRYWSPLARRVRWWFR